MNGFQTSFLCSSPVLGMEKKSFSIFFMSTDDLFVLQPVMVFSYEIWSLKIRIDHHLSRQIFLKLAFTWYDVDVSANSLTARVGGLHFIPLLGNSKFPYGSREDQVS